MRFVLSNTVRTLLAICPAALLIAIAGARCDAQVLNGNFVTGDFTDWTVFTTANGTANAGSAPNVILFNTIGSGATDSAQFNVGHLSGQGLKDPEGGGIFQNITLGAGPVAFSADFAAFETGRGLNAEGGIFDMLLDGTIISSDDVGEISPGVVRGTLSATESVTAGSHQLEFEITRPFLAGVGESPDQFLTDIVAFQSPAPMPEPGALALLLGIGSITIAWRRRAGFFSP